MQGIDRLIERECRVIKTPRVMQLEGMFDIPPSERSAERWEVRLPLGDRDWHIGLIVGPSGCGKSTLLDEIFGGTGSTPSASWPDDASVIDGFPDTMPIREIIGALSAVGFSSPHAWVRPFRVLSNGEKFRVSIARALMESPDLCVIDEFTSVVDRTVAKIGSAAVAKFVRRCEKKLIAASCHFDIMEWLQPDWIYWPAENRFEWRFLQRRPDIPLTIRKVHHSSWAYFKHHHYLSADLNKAAACYVAFWQEIPVAFMSYLHLVNHRRANTKKGHRLVVLPDYQGVGIGPKFMDYIAACLKAVELGFIGNTAQPAINHYRARSSRWKCIHKPHVSWRQNYGKTVQIKSMHVGRLLATYEYIGPAVPVEESRRVLQC